MSKTRSKANYEYFHGEGRWACYAGQGEGYNPTAQPPTDEDDLRIIALLGMVVSEDLGAITTLHLADHKHYVCRQLAYTDYYLWWLPESKNS